MTDPRTPSDVRALEAFTPYLMNRIMARYNRGVEDALKAVGVTVPQMRALTVLAEGGPFNINDLSVLTVIKPSTLSRTLDGMENTGLIRRETGDTDSRVRMIHLTEAGKIAHQTAWPEMERMRETMLASLTSEERVLLNTLLSRVLRGIRHHDF
ncbi:MarR family winged helix-turn-helix transcriptional regulator [Phaeovulum sp. W22_SRMD_FR3]|uniref:MarR family winged helix-turn-helix transcriptional regulator n=1 Tax=Phaeovulum sp. W22_SRMD_FR3 TaxID=3240274 RepID=UPI003F9AFFE4